MRHRILIGFCAVATLSLLCAFNANARNCQVASFVYYNLESLYDTIANNSEGRDLEYTPSGNKQWDTEKYRNKIDNIAYAISEMTSKTTPIGPAFIGVSEVESCTVLEDLAQNPQISAWGLKVIHHDSPNASGMDIGCLYNPKYFHPEHVTNHSQNLNFRSYDQMCVVGSLMGQRIGIIICSWPSRLGGIEASAPHRKAAAEVTRQIADSLWRVDPDMGIIIMGCFNDDPADDSVAKVLKAKKSDAVKPHELYNPWWEKADKGIATVVHQEYRNLFDQIVISGNLVGTGENRWSYFRSEVLNFDFLSNDEGEPLRTFSKGQYLNGYSDHFPVSLFLMRYVD